MASAAITLFRLPPDPHRRLGMALVASALLHALMLLSLSKYSLPGNAFARPVVAPLSVRLERLPASPEAKPIVIRARKAVLHQKPDVPKPVEIAAPADVEPSVPQPGVSVSDTLYLQPIPRRASSALLASGEFRRSSDINEKPRVVAMKIPAFPQLAAEQKASGWVIAMLFVDEDGKVLDTAAVESSESFNDYEKDVAEALRGSTFAPGKLDGRAVKTLMFVTVRFDSKALSGPETAKDLTAPVPPENAETR
jgi:hypothetical protein